MVQNEKNILSDTNETDTELGEKIAYLRGALGHLEGKSAEELRHLKSYAQDIENYLNSPANAALQMRPDVVDAVNQAKMAEDKLKEQQAEQEDKDKEAAKKAEAEYYEALAIAASLVMAAAAYASSAIALTPGMIKLLGETKFVLSNMLGSFDEAVSKDSEKPPQDVQDAVRDLKKFEQNIDEDGKSKKPLTGGDIDKAIKDNEKIGEHAEKRRKHAHERGDHENEKQWGDVCGHCKGMHGKLKELSEEALSQWREKHAGREGDDKMRAPGLAHGREKEHVVAAGATAAVAAEAKPAQQDSVVKKSQDTKTDKTSDLASEQDKQAGLVDAAEKNKGEEGGLAAHKKRVAAALAMGGSQEEDAEKALGDKKKKPMRAAEEKIPDGLQEEKHAVREEAENLAQRTEGATPADVKNIGETAEASVALSQSKSALGNLSKSISTGSRAAYEEVGGMLSALGITWDGQNLPNGIPQGAPGPTPGQANPVQAKLDRPPV